MRFFFDTEFMEDGKTIELLSIGMVSQDGREYYAVSRDADWSKASEWVQKNVLPMLDRNETKPLAQIRHELLLFVGEIPMDPHTGKFIRPEFWAYYASYDWVALCQLFGRMIDLPEGWPMFVRDVKQLAEELGDPRLPAQKKGAHHALSDAIWCKKAWEFLRALEPGKNENLKPPPTPMPGRGKPQANP